MSANYVNATLTEGVGPTFTPAKPGGVVEGQVVFMYAHVDGSGDHFGGTGSLVATVGLPTGGTPWVPVGDALNISVGDTATMMLWAKVAGASEPANYGLVTDHSLDTSIIVIAYKDVSSSSGLAAAIDASLSTNPNSATPPASPVSIALDGITTTAVNETVIWFGGVDWGTGLAAAFGDPAGTTRRAVSTPAKFSNALVADFVQASAGATGIKTGIGTLSGQSGNYGGYMVALKSGTDGNSGGGGTADDGHVIEG